MKAKCIIGFLTLVSLIAAVLAISQCLVPPHTTVSPVRFIPSDTGRVAVLEGLSRLGTELNRLAEHKAINEVITLVGGPSPSRILDEISKQWEADIRQKQSLKAAGIDSTAKVYFFTTQSLNAPVIALPAASYSDLQQWLNRRMSAFLGLSPLQTCAISLGEHVPSPAVITCYVPIRNSSSEPPTPKAISVQAGGYIYVVREDNASEVLKAVFATPEKDSLAANDDFLQSTASLGTPTIYGYAKFPEGSLTLSLNLEADANFKTRFTAVSPAESSDVNSSEKSKSLPGLSQNEFARQMAKIFAKLTNFSAFQPTPSALTTKLNPDAVVFAQSGISPTEAAAVLTRLFPRETRKIDLLLTPFGLSIATLADQFLPGTAASVSIAPDANLMAVTSPSRLRPSTLLTVLNFELLAQVKNAKSAEKILDKISMVARAIGLSVHRYTAAETELASSPSDGTPANEVLATVKGSATAIELSPNNHFPSAGDLNSKAPSTEPTDASSASMWTFGFRQGTEITVKLQPGNTLILAAGNRQTFQALSRRIPVSTDRLHPELRHGKTSATVDFIKLSKSIQAIPESSFGIGGDIIKTTLNRWLQAFDGVKAITLNASGGHGVLELSANLRLSEKSNDGQTSDNAATITPNSTHTDALP